jgi:N-acetyl-gamma-glutamyl-phosphate reductase
MTTDVAIVGTSGYAARELFRILLNHPLARITVAASRQDAGTRVDALHPSLAHRTDLACQTFDPDAIAAQAKFAFLALPHVASMEAARSLRALGVRVIDLSADYRLKDAQVYADWYDHAHTDPDGLKEAVYGLPEIVDRGRIAGAGLIANPGCYTSCAILALAPLIAHDRVARKGIIIDAKSGVSGAGRSPKITTHYPECNESLSAYNVGKHRHTPEIDQLLTEVGRAQGGNHEPVEVIFTPHLVPMDRGILATIYAEPTGPVAESDLIEMYREFYAGCPFVRVVKHLPGTKDSVGSNFFDVTLRVVRGRVVVLACLDNLIKGASGVAVQNFNLMIGCGEATALMV